MAAAWNKKKTGWYMGEYNPTQEETKAYIWCVRNNIKISPKAKEEGLWWIEITINGKTNKSPNTFIEGLVWEKLYEYCKYYYDRYKQNI